MTSWQKIFFLKSDSKAASIMGGRITNSGTRKKLPNVYKSCQKMIPLETWKTKTDLKCGQFVQNHCCRRLWKVAQSAINCPIWSHWYSRVKKWIIIVWETKIFFATLCDLCFISSHLSLFLSHYLISNLLNQIHSLFYLFTSMCSKNVLLNWASEYSLLTCYFLLLFITNTKEKKI